MFWYRLTHMVMWWLFRVIYRFRSRGAHRVPASGGVVIAANHASFMDPPMVACALVHRTLTFMARDDLFRVPFLGSFIRRVFALPIRRGKLNRTAMADFEAVLREDGCALLAFPEGTRSPDGNLGKPRRGLAAICRAAGVPVIPTLVLGTYEAWPRQALLPKLMGRIEVRFGPPVEWDDKELNATGDPNGALATLIMKRIAELHATPEAPLGFWKGYRQVLRGGDKSPFAARARLAPRLARAR